MKHESDILKKIKNYFMRRRSTDEAYDFEREAERDAFLYEAMEGFESMLSSDIQQAMDELDDALDQKVKGGFQMPNLRIAAGVAALVAAGIAAYVIVSVSSTSDAVQEKSAAADGNYEPRSSQVEYGSLPVDSLNSVAFADTMMADEPIVAVEETTEPVANAKEEPEQEALKKEEEIEPSAIKAPAKPEELEVAVAEEDTFEAELNDKSRDASTESEEQAYSVMESAPELKSKQVMQEQTVSSSESYAKKVAPKVAAQPENGMDNYEKYIRNNLQTSEGMPSGKVVLTFELDRSGKPKKIEVQKSLCTACDAEAVRVIENGPAWESDDRKERITITVDFPGGK